MTNSRHSGLGTTFLVVGLLLLALLLVAVFAPVWKCLEYEVRLPKDMATPITFSRCVACGGMRKMSLYQRWRMIQDLRADGIEDLHLVP